MSDLFTPLRNRTDRDSRGAVEVHTTEPRSHPRTLDPRSTRGVRTLSAAVARLRAG